MNKLHYILRKIDKLKLFESAGNFHQLINHLFNVNGGKTYEAKICLSQHCIVGFDYYDKKISINNIMFIQ